MLCGDAETIGVTVIIVVELTVDRGGVIVTTVVLVGVSDAEEVVEESMAVVKVLTDVTVTVETSAAACAGWRSICGEKLIDGISAALEQSQC